MITYKKNTAFRTKAVPFFIWELCCEHSGKQGGFFAGWAAAPQGGLGFAIPSATVKEIVNQIIQKGYVSGRPWLGLTGEGFSPFYQRFYRVPTGLYITQVDPGSPAEAVGVMPGDILVTMDGAGIASMEDLNAALYTHQVGDRMILSVYRNGLQADVEVTLTENKG